MEKIIAAALPNMYISDCNIWNRYKGKEIHFPAHDGCIWLSSDDDIANIYKGELALICYIMNARLKEKLSTGT